MNGCISKASLAAAVASLMLAVTGAAHAGQVTLKLVGNPLPPPPAVMQNATPMALPRPSAAQMQAAGLMKADGSLASAPARSAQATTTMAQSPRLLSKGNVGGPVQTSMEVVPVPKAITPATGTGTGVTSQMATQSGTPVPFNYGTDYEWPFTASRVELTGKLVNSKVYPYRASGLLVLNLGNGYAGLCSASLVARGVVITAAHCVAQFGVGYYNASWTYYPGYFNGKAPYGSAYAVAIGAPSAFLDGTDTCDIDKIACRDDVAVIVLAPKKGKYIGDKTGWLGVGIDGWGFNSSGQTQITQLGYPSGIDYGRQMQRDDSIGQVLDATSANNTMIGTPMNEGSSGGPWISNFGVPGTPNGVYAGVAPNPNMVVGVTSWGYVNSTMLVAGASPLTSGNIAPLLNAACAYAPAACAQ